MDNAENKSKKLKLLSYIFNSNLNCLNKIKKDPLMDLLTDFEEIEYYLHLNNPHIMLFFYSSKKKIHKILYEEEQIIDIKFDQTKLNLAYNFYLNLLINDNLAITNYSYEIQLIKELNNIRRNLNEKYKAIFYAKCIIDLINNYKELEIYDEEKEEEELNIIEDEIIKHIENNINIFKDINLNINEENFRTKTIDEIYSEIINSLIINGKLEDYDYTSNILNQLELEKISMTEKLLEQLYESLDISKDYIKKYIINKKEDFSDEKKINFYYILFRYILKNSIYVYNIPLLSEIRKFILNVIKIDELLLITNNDKLQYILQFLIDSDYYFYKTNKGKMNQLKEILIYYKEFYFQSKSEDINIIEDIIKNNKKGYEKYLLDIDRAKEQNIRLPLIKLISNLKHPGGIKNEMQIKQDMEYWKVLENMIRAKRLKKMRKEDKKILTEYIQSEDNKKILLKIFNQDQLEFLIKSFPPLEKKNEEKNEKQNIKNEIQEEKKEQKELKEDNDKPIDDNAIDKKEYEKKTSKDSYYNNNSKVMKNEIILFSTAAQSINDRQSNKKDINEIMKAKDAAPLVQQENMKSDIISKILSKSTFILHYNKKEEDPFLTDGRVFFGDNNIEIPYEEFMKIYVKKEKNNISEQYEQLKNFLKEFENELKNNFIHNYNLAMKLQLEDQNYEYVLEEDRRYNIKCIYNFQEPKNKKKFRFKEEDILINGTNSNTVGFPFLLNQINSPIYANEKYIDSNYVINQKKSNSNNKYINENFPFYKNNEKEEDEGNLKNNGQKSCIQDESTMSRTKQTFFNSAHIEKADPDKVLEFIRIIGRHIFSADYVVELSNGYFISGGCENFLILYDQDFFEKIKIKEFNDWVYKVGEKKNSNPKEKDIIKLYCTVNKEFDIVNLDKELNTSINQYQMPKKTFINFIEMKENNIVLCGRGGSSYYVDLFNTKKMLEYKITSKTYRGGIRINDKNVAITSNDVIPDGENKLIFYNTGKKKNSEINDHSFIASLSGLALIPTEEIQSKYKILLCACKRYTNGEKNGILLVNPQLGDNKDVENPFYKTDNFEVYCFCPILLVENTKILKKEIKITATNYFFVGGFDLDKREGKIKLFKIIYGDKAWETKIEFMQDIEFEFNENFEDFDGPISNIIQSKETGNILITCYNGNVYLFTPPNIEYYLEEDKMLN